MSDISFETSMSTIFPGFSPGFKTAVLPDLSDLATAVILPTKVETIG